MEGFNPTALALQTLAQFVAAADQVPPMIRSDSSVTIRCTAPYAGRLESQWREIDKDRYSKLAIQPTKLIGIHRVWIFLNRADCWVSAHHKSPRCLGKHLNFAGFLRWISRLTLG